MCVCIYVETDITDEALQHSNGVGSAWVNLSASVTVFHLIIEKIPYGNLRGVVKVLITYYLLRLVLMLFFVCPPLHFSFMTTMFYL